MEEACEAQEVVRVNCMALPEPGPIENERIPRIGSFSEEFLRYHVVVGKFLSIQLTSPQDLNTLQGDPSTFDPNPTGPFSPRFPVETGQLKTSTVGVEDGSDRGGPRLARIPGGPMWSPGVLCAGQWPLFFPPHACYCCPYCFLCRLLGRYAP